MLNGNHSITCKVLHHGKTNIKELNMEEWVD